MKQNDPLRQSLTRRVLLLSFLKTTALCGLVGRLYYLQFLKSEEYQTLAEGNRIKVQLIAPARAVIRDRLREPLAMNEVNYRLFVEREDLERARSSCQKVAELLEIPAEALELLLSKITRRLRHKPLLIKEHLEWSEVVKVEYHLLDLPGVYIEEGQVRHYPWSEKAAHLIGYVGRVSEEEMDEKNPLLRLPEFKIGKNGVELQLEQEVRGRPGTRQVEVNASGFSVRELKYQAPETADDVLLTIDAELQRFAAERIAQESGTIIVMKVQTGEVLAMVSVPAFDPNQFSRGITNSYWKELNDNEKNPLLNKCLSGLYPPGSTFKMVTGLAGMAEGAVRSDTRFYCPGHYRLGNHRFNCWKAGGHGWMNVEEALAESCDTFFYNVANEIGIEPISAMGHRLGLGQKSGLGLQGEKVGILPTPEWKIEHQGTPWVGGDAINASIGQGYVLTSPLQLAVMMARLANGGKQVMPSLLQGEAKPDEWEDLGIGVSHIMRVQEGMRRVVNDEHGTAYYRRIKEEGMEMGGKTGTSQVRRITRRGMKQELLPWKYRHHGLFVGYAPVYQPRFVVSVVIEHGGGGSSAAAPVARDVLQKVQELERDHPGRYE